MAGPRTSPPEDHFAVVKLRFALSNEDANWLRFTRAHPDAVVRVLATRELAGEKVMSDLDVIGTEPLDYTHELESLPGIDSVALLASRGTRARFRVVAQEPTYLRIADRLAVLLRYPRTIQDGEYTVEVAARVSQLQELTKELQAVSPHVEVLRFGRDPMRTSPPSLTSRQYALLHQALAAGYFDVPRRITLTRLAAALGRSKSSLSRSLALVERELAETSAMAAP